MASQKLESVDEEQVRFQLHLCAMFSLAYSPPSYCFRGCPLARSSHACSSRSCPHVKLRIAIPHIATFPFPLPRAPSHLHPWPSSNSTPPRYPHISCSGRLAFSSPRPTTSLSPPRIAQKRREEITRAKRKRKEGEEHYALPHSVERISNFSRRLSTASPRHPCPLLYSATTLILCNSPSTKLFQTHVLRRLQRFFPQPPTIASS